MAKGGCTEASAWKQKAITLAQETNLSWREIAHSLDVPKSSVSDVLRQFFAQGGKKLDNSCILNISDLHAPYNHKDAIDFLAHLKDKYKPTRVILLGDEADMHALSYHEKDPSLHSASHELEAAKKVIAKLYKLFPEADILESNHGSLVWRKAKTHGIPRQYIKSYNEVLGVGEGWKWHPDMMVILPSGEKVYYHHGKSADAIKVSQQYGCSYVCGHYHESFGIKYWSTPTGLHFAVNSGCLVDRKSLAFAYANNNMKRPIIGTSLIVDSHPVLEVMEL